MPGGRDSVQAANLAAGDSLFSCPGIRAELISKAFWLLTRRDFLHFIVANKSNNHQAARQQKGQKAASPYFQAEYSFIFQFVSNPAGLLDFRW